MQRHNAIMWIKITEKKGKNRSLNFKDNWVIFYPSFKIIDTNFHDVIITSYI